MGGTIAGQKLSEGIAGDIDLGLSNDNTFQYMRSEKTVSEKIQDSNNTEILDNINHSLLKLLDYMEIIAGERLHGSY